MTRAPWVMAKPPKAWGRPGEVSDTSLGWRLVNPRMAALDGGDATLGLGECTEKLARIHGITRKDADAYAARSQQLAAGLWQAGAFDGEIVAVETATGAFLRDETVRADTTEDSLGALQPVFGNDGVCTAGNSSPLSDGASAVLVVSEQAVDEHGLQPRARILSYAVAGVAPSLFGIGPVPAIQRALARAGVALGDVDAVEINEAFAAQVLACERGLGLDRERLNPAGGAIALGHPLGSSGCRVALSVIGHLERTGGRIGVASLCIGVGQGAAMVIERV